MKMLLQHHYRTPTDDFHAMLNILKVNDMFKTNILSLVNRCLLFDVPPVFYECFKYQEVNYDLRFKRLEVPRFRNNYGMFRVAVNAPTCGTTSLILCLGLLSKNVSKSML